MAKLAPGLVHSESVSVALILLVFSITMEAAPAKICLFCSIWHHGSCRLRGERGADDVLDFDPYLWLAKSGSDLSSRASLQKDMFSGATILDEDGTQALRFLESLHVYTLI